MKKKHLPIIITLIFIFSFFSSRIQTSFGNTRVISLKIPTQNGQWVVADLFKPSTANKKKPAPLVIVVPGFQRSKETLSNISIELSRRGIVVIAIDPYAQGGSSSSMSTRAATKEGYGMFSIVDYIYNTSNLNYIDKSRIGVTGHSAGGLASIRGAQYFGKEAKKTNTISKIHSVFVSGMIRMGFEPKNLKNIMSNVGVSYALYDEGAWQNELTNGEMSQSPEVLRLINHQLFRKKEPLKSVEIGKFYGKSNLKNLTVIYNEKVLHPLQPYDKEATKNQIDYFLKAFELDNSILSDNQVWYWKELFTFISLILSFFIIIPLTNLFLELSYFSTIKHSVPKLLPSPKGFHKLIFWGLFITSALIACFSFIPMSELSKILFSESSNRIQTWFFPQRMNNAIMLWAILNGIIGFILFFGSYYLFGKNNKVTPDMWGGGISFLELVKTTILALIIFTIYFLILFIIYYLFHVDYRFIFLGVKTFRPELLYLLPLYMPLFFIFFLSNSLRVNGSLRLSKYSKNQHLFLSGIANTAGLILILLIQYLHLYFTGTVYWKEGWLYVNLLFAIVPIMLILPFFHYSFFQLTGRIYLGPITMSLIFIMILLSNTVCYIPL